MAVDDRQGLNTLLRTGENTSAAASPAECRRRIRGHTTAGDAEGAARRPVSERVASASRRAAGACLGGSLHLALLKTFRLLGAPRAAVLTASQLGCLDRGNLAGGRQDCTCHRQVRRWRHPAGAAAVMGPDHRSALTSLAHHCAVAAAGQLAPHPPMQDRLFVHQGHDGAQLTATSIRSLGDQQFAGGHPPSFFCQSCHTM